MIGTLLTIAIIGYTINSCMADNRPYATCKVKP